MQSRSVIIGIHGLANKPPAEEKSNWWRAAITEGIRRNAATADANFDFDFVYWADLRYDAPLSDAENLEPYYVDPGMGTFPHHEGTDEEAGLTLADTVYRKLGWLEEKTGITILDDAILEYRLDDLWHYYDDAPFRDAARARLRAALDRHAGSRILLAAHSMGSIIAYDVMRILDREGSNLAIDHFVTVGSPLGLADVKLKIEAEHGDVRTPERLRRWTNLVDRDDIATVGADLSEDYAPNGRGVRAVDVPVINAYRRPDGSHNHHKSYGYLRTPEFSRAALEFLGRSDAARILLESIPTGPAPGPERAEHG